MKYRPDFPTSFGSLADAREHCQRFFTWYNTEHYHSRIGWHHPINVHYGHATTVREARADVLTAAYTAQPRTVRTQTPRTTQPTHRSLDQQTRHTPGVAD